MADAFNICDRTRSINLSTLTIATLPVGVVGDVAIVSDALAPTLGGVLVAGGAITVMVKRVAAGWVS